MEFPYIGFDKKVIIAMKGLPCTGKSEIARLIGQWAKCPVLYIDDFLGTTSFSLEKNYSRESTPSQEEAERLHRLAFEALCKSAHRYYVYARGFRGCVVIKSRLCTTFELDHLLNLSREDRDASVTIIIIEFQVKNEHRLCFRLEYYVENIPEHEQEWYKPWSRLDFEKFRDDWFHSQADWDRHLCNLINADEEHPARVIRMVLDPFDDLGIDISDISDLIPAFQDAIRYLLNRYIVYDVQEVNCNKEQITRDRYNLLNRDRVQEEEWIGEQIIRDRYEVVQFDKLRRYLVKKEILSTSGFKSVYICPTASGGKCCTFKTYAKDYYGWDLSCGVCEERVVSGYTCQFCFITLHKSCTEHQGVNFSEFASNENLALYPMFCKEYVPRTYACESCREREKDFSNSCKSCLYTTHLKCRKFPTIMNHDCHYHPLSFQVGQLGADYNKCKACGVEISVGHYGCYDCGLYYCLVCVLRPGKVEHNHGGHEHVMKLVYSRDAIKLEEDYWCGICYGDMDPQDWFYSCSDCPCYEAHSFCIMPHKYE